MKKMNLKKGFTLIELLVVIFIMVTLVGVVLANFSGLSGPRNLKIARDNIISDLRRAQSQSLSARNISSGVVAFDYGVGLSIVSAPPSSYTTLADDNSATPVLSTLSTLNLPGNVYIKQILITRSDSSSTTASSLQVFFTVPYGRVLQTYSGGPASQTRDPNAVTTVTISTSDNTRTLTFTINGISGTIGP